MSSIPFFLSILYSNSPPESRKPIFKIEDTVGISKIPLPFTWEISDIEAIASKKLPTYTKKKRLYVVKFVKKELLKVN